MTGIALDCTLPIERAAKSSVRARAEWASGLSPKLATLEIRREDR